MIGEREISEGERDFAELCASWSEFKGRLSEDALRSLPEESVAFALFMAGHAAGLLLAMRRLTGRGGS